jgi:molybdopterin synthase sulfur carrier subunit
MKKIHVRYFAILREQMQKSSETILTDCNTVGELFLELKQKHNLTSEIENIRFALNQNYVERDTLIQGDENIVFIPPVAGG